MGAVLVFLVRVARPGAAAVLAVAAGTPAAEMVARQRAARGALAAVPARVVAVAQVIRAAQVVRAARVLTGRLRFCTYPLARWRDAVPGVDYPRAV